MDSECLIIYLTSAIDEKTKVNRGITTDSPAATNKVLAIASAMQSAGINCKILSIGRGRKENNGHRHRATIIRLKQRICIVYAAFWQWPLITHLISSFSLAYLLLKLVRKDAETKVLAYNRAYHYVPSLLIARLLKLSVYLDLEDGFNNDYNCFYIDVKNRFTRAIFNWLCPNGAIIANHALRSQLAHNQTLVCYGVIESSSQLPINWTTQKLQILFGGTLVQGAGCQLLIDAIKIIRAQNMGKQQQLHFVVTGKGPHAADFKSFADYAPEWLTFYGDLTHQEYIRILRSSHIGVSLRLGAFGMATTTFPSKVIEYAESGLAVLTTEASDIPILFGDSAVYLKEETPVALSTLLCSLPHQRSELMRIAIRGRLRVVEFCDKAKVGSKLEKFFSTENPGN